MPTLLSPLADPSQPDVTLKLTAQDAQRQAAGKAIALAGSVIGTIGAVMALSVHPAYKNNRAKAKITGLLMLGVAGASIVAYFANRQQAGS